jgi:hypothetical protein
MTPPSGCRENDKRKIWYREESDDVSVHQEGIGSEEVDDGVDPLEGLRSSVARVRASPGHRLRRLR